MAKYDPLGGHLRRARLTEMELSFDDIERVLGAMLPKSAARAEWWANEIPANSKQVQCHAWIGACYEAQLLGKQRVRFCRSPKDRV